MVGEALSSPPGTDPRNEATVHRLRRDLARATGEREAARGGSEGPADDPRRERLALAEARRGLEKEVEGWRRRAGRLAERCRRLECELRRMRREAARGGGRTGGRANRTLRSPSPRAHHCPVSRLELADHQFWRHGPGLQREKRRETVERGQPKTIWRTLSREQNKQSKQGTGDEGRPDMTSAVDHRSVERGDDDSDAVEWVEFQAARSERGPVQDASSEQASIKDNNLVFGKAEQQAGGKHDRSAIRSGEAGDREGQVKAPARGKELGSAVDKCVRFEEADEMAENMSELTAETKPVLPSQNKSTFYDLWARPTMEYPDKDPPRDVSPPPPLRRLSSLTSSSCSSDTAVENEQTMSRPDIFWQVNSNGADTGSSALQPAAEDAKSSFTSHESDPKDGESGASTDNAKGELSACSIRARAEMLLRLANSRERGEISDREIRSRAEMLLRRANRSEEDRSRKEGEPAASASLDPQEWRRRQNRRRRGDARALANLAAAALSCAAAANRASACSCRSLPPLMLAPVLVPALELVPLGLPPFLLLPTLMLAVATMAVAVAAPADPLAAGGAAAASDAAALCWGCSRR